MRQLGITQSAQQTTDWFRTVDQKLGRRPTIQSSGPAFTNSPLPAVGLQQQHYLSGSAQYSKISQPTPLDTVLLAPSPVQKQAWRSTQSPESNPTQPNPFSVTRSLAFPCFSDQFGCLARSLAQMESQIRQMCISVCMRVRECMCSCVCKGSCCMQFRRSY